MNVDGHLSIMYTQKMIKAEYRRLDILTDRCVDFKLFLVSYSVEDTGWVADLNHVTNVMDKLNNRFRNCLGFRTPHEVH